jgi:arginyl-tRNA--protein-N-Asp/Glu arginylyltransferase
MAYKAKFQPLQGLQDDRWQLINTPEESLE